MKTFSLKAALLTAGFILTACGGSTLDAKNGETLQASLKSIASGMSESERQQFGQDFMLVSQVSAEDASKVPLSWLYEDNYGMLFQDGASDLDPGLYSRIALNAGDRLDGKTPKALHADAVELRASVFDAMSTTETERAATLTTGLAEARTGLAKLEAEYEAAQAANADIEAKRDKAVSNLRLTWESYNRGGTRPTYRALADVTNYSDKPIKRVYFITRAQFENFPGYGFRDLISGLTLDTPLAPGETRKDVEFKLSFVGVSSLTREEDAAKTPIAELFGAATPLKNVTTEFKNYADTNGRRFGLSLDRDTAQAFQQNERKIANCRTSLENVEAAIASHTTRAEAFAELAKKPVDTLDDLPRAPRVGRAGACG